MSGSAWLVASGPVVEGWARLPEPARDDLHPAFRDARSFARLDRAAKLLALGVSRAIGDRDVSGDATGLVLGSWLGCLEADERFDATRALPEGAHPALFPATLPTSPAAEVSIRLGIRGPVLSVSSGGASLRESLSVARRWLRRGEATLVLACGLEVAARGAARVTGRPGPFAESVAIVLLEREADATDPERGALPRDEVALDLLGNSVRA